MFCWNVFSLLGMSNFNFEVRTSKLNFEVLAFFFQNFEVATLGRRVAPRIFFRRRV